MKEEQIRQAAEEYATFFYDRKCALWKDRYYAYIEGARSRDEEIEKWKEISKTHMQVINELHLELDQLRYPWISVDERLPEENAIVLARSLHIIDGGGEHSEEEQLLVQRYKGKWCTDDMRQQRMGGYMFDLISKVTHWMSIPELLKGGEK